MNKKGFTLIELVTVIALLGIISIIAFVSIFAVIEKNKVSNCENLLLSIKSASSDFVSDNRYYINGDKMMNSEIKTVAGRKQKYVEITAFDLVSGVFLSGPITDPFDNSVSIEPNDIGIRIYLLDDYTVGYVPVNDADKTESIIIRNKSGNVVNCNSKQW